MKTDNKGRIVIQDEYDRITKEQLMPGDILLFIYGNKLTEFHGRNRRKELGRSTLPPYHAAIVYDVTTDNYDDRIFILDPEIITGFSLLDEYTTKSSIRIDVVHYTCLIEQRQKIVDTIRTVGTKEGLYDVGGYGAFISQMPFLGWMKYIIRPSKTKFFCSDAVVYCCEAGEVTISRQTNNYTAPVDIQLYALEYHKLFTLKQRGELI